MAYLKVIVNLQGLVHETEYPSVNICAASVFMGAIPFCQYLCDFCVLFVRLLCYVMPSHVYYIFYITSLLSYAITSLLRHVSYYMF